MTEEERILRLKVPKNWTAVHYCPIDENGYCMNDIEKTVPIEDLERAPRPEKEIWEELAKPANQRDRFILLKTDPVRVGWIDGLRWAYKLSEEKKKKEVG